MMPVTITTVSPRPATGCPGGSSTTVVARSSVLQAAGPTTLRYHQPWSQRCLDGHVAVWLCRIGGVARGDEAHRHLLSGCRLGCHHLSRHIWRHGATCAPVPATGAGTSRRTLPCCGGGGL